MPDEFGEPLAVYRQSWVTMAIGMAYYGPLAALLVAVLTVRPLRTDSIQESRMVTCMLIALGWYIWVGLIRFVPQLLRPRSVTVYAHGLGWHQHRYRWHELDGLQVSVGVTMRGDIGYALMAGGQTILRIDDRLRYSERLINLIANQLAAQTFPAFRAALARGETLTAGGLRLNAEALGVGKEQLARDTLYDATFGGIQRSQVIFKTLTRDISFSQWSHPQTLLLALFVAREWLPRTPTTPDLLDLSLPVDCPALGLHLDSDGLTVTHALGHTTRYPLARVAYGYDGTRLTLLVDGVEHGPLDACLALADALTIALAWHWLPAYREALAAGESVSFGAVTLWDDHLTDSTSGLVIQREAVSQWRDDGRRGTVFYDHFRREMGVIPYRHVVNPALCWALMGAWGSDVQVMDEWLLEWTWADVLPAWLRRLGRRQRDE